MNCSLLFFAMLSRLYGGHPPPLPLPCAPMSNRRPRRRQGALVTAIVALVMAIVALVMAIVALVMAIVALVMPMFAARHHLAICHRSLHVRWVGNRPPR